MIYHKSGKICKIKEDRVQLRAFVRRGKGIFFRGNLSERNLCTRDKNVEMKEGHSCAQKSQQAECDKLGKRIRRNLCGTGRYTKAKDRKMVCKGAAVLA